MKILSSGILHSYKEIFGFRVITFVDRTYTVQLGSSSPIQSGSLALTTLVLYVQRDPLTNIRVLHLQPVK